MSNKVTDEQLAILIADEVCPAKLRALSELQQLRSCHSSDNKEVSDLEILMESFFPGYSGARAAKRSKK